MGIGCAKRFVQQNPHRSRTSGLELRAESGLFIPSHHNRPRGHHPMRSRKELGRKLTPPIHCDTMPASFQIGENYWLLISPVEELYSHSLHLLLDTLKLLVGQHHSKLGGMTSCVIYYFWLFRSFSCRDCV